MIDIEKDLMNLMDEIVNDTDIVETQPSDSTSVITIDSNQTECCICLELINKSKNNCITECGHMFCLKCLATTMYHDTWNCPYCRTAIVDIPHHDDEDEDDDDSDYEFEVVDENDDGELEEGEIRERPQRRRRRLEDEVSVDDDDNTTISDYVEDPNAKPCTVEEITRRLVENGITMEDIVSLYFCRPKGENPDDKSPEVLNMMEDLDTKISDIVDAADTESYERQDMEREDVRV